MKFNQSLYSLYSIQTIMTNTQRQWLAALAATTIIVAVLVASVPTSQTQVFAQQVPATLNEKTVSATGTATTSVDPDLLNINFGVETEAKTAKEAMNANSEAMAQIVAAIKKLGITEDELGTSGFNIYPVYKDITDPTTGIYLKSELSGYRVSNILHVKTTQLTLASSILDVAVEAGANRVDGVYFTLSPKTQLAVQNDLIEQAVLNAKSKAEKAIAPLGKKIIVVKMVSLSDFAYLPPPIYYGGYATAEVAYSKALPIFSSDQDVTTTVNVVFLIGDQ